MQNVPLNRILIQPTVQLKWIEQHGELFFNIEKQTLTQFLTLWSQYQKSDCTNVREFLTSKSGLQHQLHEEDVLFALLVGADHISRFCNGFQTFERNEKLIFSIEYSNGIPED